MCSTCLSFVVIFFFFIIIYVFVKLPPLCTGKADGRKPHLRGPHLRIRESSGRGHKVLLLKSTGCRISKALLIVYPLNYFMLLFLSGHES